MPREVGRARKADLVGHFAGEQHDAVSPLVRFLVNAKQVNEVEEGKALGSDTSALLPAAAEKKSSDTEAYPPALAPAHDNGHSGNGHVGNNGHSGNGAVKAPANRLEALSPSLEMEPEPQMESDLFGDPAPPQAPQDIGSETAIDVAPVSSGDTVHDMTTRLPPPPKPEPAPLAAEPQALAAEPAPLAAQEMHPLSAEPEMQPMSLDAEPALHNDTAFDLHPQAAMESAPLAPDTVYEPPPMKPEEAKTRIVTGDELKARSKLAEKTAPQLSLEPEEAKLETGPIMKLSAEDAALGGEVDEDTSLVKEGREDPEKITTKVDPKSAASKAPAGAVVRDTVNFYNQTTALRDLLESNNRPVPTGPVSEATQKVPPPPQKAVPLAASLAPEEEEITDDTLEPEETVLPALSAAAHAETVEDAQTRAFMRDDLQPGVSVDDGEVDPSQNETREVRALAEAPELAASEDHEEADRKDTDRFQVADMRPAELPPPEGTDKLDKTDFPPTGEPVRVADENIAARRDTQRFFVSDLVGVATFSPAPKPVPLADESESSGSTTGTQTEIDRTSEEEHTEVARQAPSSARLPRISERIEDFAPPPVDSSTRIVPEAALAARSASSRRVPAQPEKITEKVKQEAEQNDTDRVAPDEAAAVPVKRVTDALTRRLRQERDETKKLIEEAESVLLRLRLPAPQVAEPVGAAEQSIDLAEPAPPRDVEVHVGVGSESEPQLAAAPEDFQDGLPPLDQIASATIHDVRLAEELLEASKAIAQKKIPSARFDELPTKRQPAAGEPQPVLHGKSARAPTLRDAVTGRASALGGNGHSDDAPGNGDSQAGETALGEQIVVVETHLLSDIEKRLDGATRNLDRIFTSTSQALARVTGELTREEFEARKRQRDAEKSGASGRRPAYEEPEGEDNPYESLSLDELIAAASGSYSATSTKAPPRTASGRRIVEEEAVSARTSAKLATDTLSDDLAQLFSDAARKTSRMQRPIEVEPKPEEEPAFDLTQGPMWQTLAGIAGVTAFLAGLFIWILFMISSRGA